jgi:chromosome partitioning protein
MVAVDVAPSSPRLAQREHQLAMDVIGAQDRLAVAAEGLVDDYDEVIIDCPPSLGLLTVNALFAADRVLIVAEPAAWSSDGVEQILRNIGRIAERRGGRPAVAGIVVNRLGRTRDATYWDGQLRELHPDLVIEPSVRLRAAVAEAAAQSSPVHGLTRDGAAEAAAEFDELARVLGMVRRPDPAPTDSATAEPAPATHESTEPAPTEPAPAAYAPPVSTTTGDL